MLVKFARYLCVLVLAAVMGGLAACNLSSVPAISTPTVSLPADVLPPTATSRPARTPIPTLDQRILNPDNGHLYLLVQNAATWSRARRYCTTLGGHLATIESETENTLVYGLSNGYTWLGASDDAEEGTWIWVTGEPWSFTNWNDGEPNNCCPPEICGGTGCTPEHSLTYTENMTWNDAPVFEEMYFVCEWDDGP